MFCVKCGRQLNDYAAFCPYCGNAVKKETSKPEIASNRKSIPLAVCFIVLTVLEYVMWVVLSSRYDCGNNSLFPTMRKSRYYMLLGPIVNILFTVFLFTGKKALYRIAVIYGMVSSIFIASGQILYFFSNIHYFLSRTIPIRIAIMGILSIFAYILMLIFSRKPARCLPIISGSAMAVRNIVFLVLYQIYPILYSKNNPIFRNVLNALRRMYYLGVLPALIFYIVVIVFDVVLYIFLARHAVNTFSNKSKS